MLSFYPIVYYYKHKNKKKYFHKTYDILKS